MWIRWLKFNFVGVVGVGVQLAVLEVLTRFAHVEYMIATALPKRLENHFDRITGSVMA